MSRLQFEVLSVLEGMTSWGASSVADSFWGAAALACGASSGDLAALASVPTLVGSIAQLFAALPHGARARPAFARSRQRIIGAAFLVQAAVLAAVAGFLVPRSVRRAGALAPVTEVPGLCSSRSILLGAAVHGSVGMAAGPIWSEWVAAVVPPSERGRFFGIKNAAGVLASAAVLALSARLFARHDFAVVFGLAFFLRLCSFIFIVLTKDPVEGQHPSINQQTKNKKHKKKKKQSQKNEIATREAREAATTTGASETTTASRIRQRNSLAQSAPAPFSQRSQTTTTQDGQSKSKSKSKDNGTNSNKNSTQRKEQKKQHKNAWEKMWRDFQQAARVPGFWRAVLLFVGTNAAGTVASAFFTSYTLRSLRLDEQHYVALNIASTVARFLISPLWGVAVDRRGPLRSAALSIALMIPLPLVLVLSRQSFATAAAFQVLTGVLGAGYDTARLPVLLALAPRPRLTTALIQLYNLVNGVACFLASGLSVRAAARYGRAFHHAPVVSFALSFLLRLIVFLLWLALSLRGDSSSSSSSSGSTTNSSNTHSGAGAGPHGEARTLTSRDGSTAAQPAPPVSGLHGLYPLASPLRFTTKPLPLSPSHGPQQQHPHPRQQQQQQQQQQQNSS